MKRYLKYLLISSLLTTMMLHSVFYVARLFAIPVMSPSVVATQVDQEYQQAVAHIQKLGHEVTPQLLVVDIATQTLSFYEAGKLQQIYRISSSKRGTGSRLGSLRTPIGLHKIVKKYGADVPHYGIFKARAFTGRVAQPVPQAQALGRRDAIVTRILQLEGLESGLNRGRDWSGHNVDSLQRGIYIHGTLMEWKLGTPCSIGCIHLSSGAVMQLFDKISEGTCVLITESYRTHVVKPCF